MWAWHDRLLSLPLCQSKLTLWAWSWQGFRHLIWGRVWADQYLLYVVQYCPLYHSSSSPFQWVSVPLSINNPLNLPPHEYGRMSSSKIPNTGKVCAPCHLLFSLKSIRDHHWLSCNTQTISHLCVVHDVDDAVKSSTQHLEKRWESVPYQHAHTFVHEK